MIVHDVSRGLMLTLVEGFPTESSILDFIFGSSFFLYLMPNPSGVPFEMNLAWGSPGSPLLPLCAGPSAHLTSISATNFQNCPLILTLLLQTHVPHPSFHDSFTLNLLFFQSCLCWEILQWLQWESKVIHILRSAYSQFHFHILSIPYCPTNQPPAGAWWVYSQAFSSLNTIHSLQDRYTDRDINIQFGKYKHIMS